MASINIIHDSLVSLIPRDHLSFPELPKSSLNSSISSLKLDRLQCRPSFISNHTHFVPRACASSNESQGGRALSFKEYDQKINGIVKKESSGNGSAVKSHVYAENSDLKSIDQKSDRIPEPPLYHQGGLIDGGLAYREKFTIRCYEVGMNKTASIETIANLMQEIGVNHARSVGFSNDGLATTPLMRERKLIWVTTRMHIEMDDYPRWGDVIVMDTWFQNVSNILSRRDWIIRSEDSNEIIGRATSSWVMMNEETRRLSRIPTDVKEEYAKLCPNPPRFALENEKSEKIERLCDSSQFVCKNLMPRRGDLDMNQHVNNVTYIEWMLSCLPSSLNLSAEISKITLEYRQECRGGDRVDSMASFSGNSPKMMDSHQLLPSSEENGGHKIAISPSSVNCIEFIHLLRFNDDSKREINRGRTVWRVKGDCSI